MNQAFLAECRRQIDKIVKQVEAEPVYPHMSSESGEQFDRMHQLERDAFSWALHFAPADVQKKIDWIRQQSIYLTLQEEQYKPKSLKEEIERSE